MFSRLLPAAPGSIGLAGIACLAIGYHGGIDAGAIAAFAGATAGTIAYLRAADANTGLRRQFILAAVLFTIHAVALYTFGAGGRGAVLPLGLQGALALGAALLCATLGSRRSADGPVADAVNGEDAEDTLEIDAAETRSSPALVAPPPVRGLLITGVALTAAFVLATIYWLEDEGPQARIAAADAGETRAGTTATLPAPAAGEEPAEVSEAGTAELLDAPPPPATSMPAITASDARRECMAQIETARLFLTMAREAASAAAYAEATGVQIQRILATRPVGPRTLARIAERMWEQREAPEREAGWWSGQFSRCEAARSSGTWYVVRG